MVAVYNKELLSWYLITLKLRETLQNQPKSIEPAEPPHQHHHQQLIPSKSLDEMKEIEEKARACYEGPLSLATHEFVEMLVLDGCFILEIFRGYVMGFEKLGYKRNDPIFAMRSMMYSIRRDIMMLENQIPLFVLDRLLGIQMGDPKKTGLVAKLALIFLDPLSPTDEPLTATEKTKLNTSLSQAKAMAFDPLSDLSGLHCLDVFRRSLLHKGREAAPRPSHWYKKWSMTTELTDTRQTQLIHCVTDLKEAGVKFRNRKTDRFWDIKFKKGVLQIPRLLVHDGTKSLFLNLVSFEQSHLNSSNNITAYVVFMDNLINSAEDVRYLHYCGIIEHWLGSDVEVANMLNHLCQEVVFDINDSYLAKVSEEINRHYNKRWNTWRASLKHKYFYNPWAVISFLAAVFLLFLTFGQTFYTVYGYHKPPHK